MLQVFRVCRPRQTAARRATWAKVQDEAADHSAGTAPRRGQSFMQGNRLEQAALAGPVDHLGEGSATTVSTPTKE